MQRTKIEWCDYTWNPIVGCLKGCKYCYARKIATRFAGGGAFPKGFEPTFHPERLADHFPKRPSKIFVCSMGELFGDWIPDWQIKDVFGTIQHYPKHTFIFLTKQPQNLIKWTPFPDNCWVGVSVTSNAEMTNAYYGLSGIHAGKRFISFEPLLGDIGINDHVNIKEWLDWVIIGAQTKPYRPPRVEWVKDIVDAADKAGIPVFLKDNLGWPKYSDAGSQPFYKRLKGTWNLRQELPECPRL